MAQICKHCGRTRDDVRNHYYECHDNKGNCIDKHEWIEDCHLIYGYDGYLICSTNHKIGDKCLMKERET
jgi:hypothetical protein